MQGSETELPEHSQSFQEEIGIRIRRLRKSRGWTQATVELRGGMKLMRLSQLENGRYGPQLDTIVAVARGLEVSLHVLLCDSSDSPAEKSTAPIMESLATRVKLLRQRRGWTLVQMAKESGLSKWHLCRFELCHISPRIYTLVRIAGAFGMSLHELLCTGSRDEEFYRECALEFK